MTAYDAVFDANSLAAQAGRNAADKADLSPNYLINQAIAKMEDSLAKTEEIT